MRSALIFLIIVSFCLGAAQIDSTAFKKVRSDSAFITAQKTQRIWIDTMRNEIKIFDSSKGIILKTKNGTIKKFWRIQIDSTGALTTDSSGIN